MTFHDFFLDLFKFCKALGHFQKFSKLSLFWSIFDLKQLNRHKLWWPPKCLPFGQFNYSSLSYIVLALSSAVTKLPNKTLIFHDFHGPTIQFHDFRGLENEILKFHNFPGFPWPVRTVFWAAKRLNFRTVKQKKICPVPCELTRPFRFYLTSVLRLTSSAITSVSSHMSVPWRAVTRPISLLSIFSSSLNNSIITIKHLRLST